MKRFTYLFLALITFSLSLFAEDKNESLIYQFDINTEINSSSWLYTQKAIAEAKSMNASLFLIKMNTYGGEVVFADSIRTAIVGLDIPTVVFIDNNAASAGALISLACDRIYMVGSGTMGATTVVSGGSGEKAPDKYQSYMRATMRATAESHGRDSATNKWHRDPVIAEAMVDENNRVDSGRVLTLTANEAIEVSYCEGIYSSVKEVIEAEGFGADTKVVVYEPTSVDKIKGSLLGTALRSILIMLIIGGIFYELKTPGIGFSLLVAVIAAILYFAPLFIDGLAAYWEIAVFIIGIGLIFLEVFAFPGFGVAGIAGILLVIIGLMFSLISNDITFNFETFKFDNILWDNVGNAAGTVLFGIIGSFALILYISSRIGSTGIFAKFALDKEQSIEDGYISVEKENAELIGKDAIVVSDLRPSGRIEISGRRYDAVALNGYIEKGSTVRIVKMRSGNVYVDTY